MPSVMLDAGHYGHYNRSPAINTYWESLMSWELHLYLKGELETYGIKVGLTRSVQANDMPLMDRGRASKGYDLFISIHSNAVGSTVREDIDYPVAYTCVSGKADKIALAMAKCVEETMGTAQKGYISKRYLDGGGDYYGVLRGAAQVGTPGFILEHSFHTQTKATRWLLNSDNLKKMAKAEAKVIANYFGIKNVNIADTEKSENWYRIRKTWADATSQLGAYVSLERAKQACPNGYTVFDSNGKAVYTNGGTEPVVTTGLQAKELAGLSEAEAVAKMGPYFTANQRESGILAAVSMAQFILESGYGKTELAQNANNCFGMKKSLSGNTWGGSTWDGKTIYTKQTREQNADGSYVTITADFRKYPCVEDSIADHSAYLLGAKNGAALRYAGLKGETDYKKAAQIIKDGGYATSLTYVKKLCDIIERWNLTKYNVKSEVVHQDPAAFKPYLVRVLVSNLNIRKGPGINYAKTGSYTGKGVFTIVAESSGDGAPKWGKLKSGVGWIALNDEWVENV